MKIDKKLGEGIKKQLITDIEPGSILKDFNTLLEIISITKLPLTPTNVSIAANHLPKLNERMASPHKIVVPEKISTNLYPNLKALFLLLRASNLTVIEEGKPSVIAIHQNYYNQWLKLNANEQYFCLLKSWLVNGHPEIIGNKDEIWRSISELIYFGKNCIDNCWNNPDGEKHLSYSPGHANLALMKMFGLAKIEENVSQSLKWEVTKISLTEFGTYFFGLFEFFDYSETEEFMKEILKHRPEVKNEITIEARKKASGSFRFKVSVLSCSRTIEVPSDYTLHDFLNEILEAFEFDADHLYAFYIKNKLGASQEYGHPELDCDNFADEVEIGELDLTVSQEFKLTYDFGDNWRFKVKLESIDTNSKIKKAKIVAKKGEAPDQYNDFSF